MAEKAPWEEYAEQDAATATAEDRPPWEEYGAEKPPKKAQKPAAEPKKKREVGFFESAGRTLGQAATTAVGHLGLAAAGLATPLGPDAQDAVFKAREGVLDSMGGMYSQKEDEEFSTTGSFAGGLASAPIEIAAGLGTQHGSQRATEVLDRGGSLSDANTAGVVSAGVHGALNALPVKAGGTIGRAIESKVGGTLAGALTGGAIAAGGGSVGRAVENAALPEGEQFKDLKQDVAPSAAEAGLGAAFGALPGGRAAGGAAVKAAGDKRRAGEAQDRARKMEVAGTAIDADIPVAPHQLSGNKFLKYLGETLEHVPISGGARNREARTRNYSAGLARAINPESNAVSLDDITFNQLQDTAGARIGDIAARTDVPVESFGDLADIARRDTPDVQQVIAAYAKDLQTIADQNGGVVPGTTLRKLRTEAQAQQRGARGGKGDLANALDRLTHRFDDALSEHAPEGDMTALLDARRQYAISKTLEPLVAKYPDGNFPAAALKSVVTATKDGKHRMATGKAGTLGDYAELGSTLLREQATSGTGERNLIYRLAGDAAAVGKLATLYPVAAAYNAFGPKVVRRMVEAARRRKAAAAGGAPPDDFNPGTSQGFEGVPQGGPRTPPRPGPGGPLGDLTPEFQTAPGAADVGGRLEVVPTDGLVRSLDEQDQLPQGIPARPGSEIPLAQDRPLGDLTPDFETAPGAAPTRGRSEVVPTEGLVQAPDDLPPPARIVRSGDPRMQRAAPQMPTVEGRPDLPSTMVAETPAGGRAVMADQATIDAAGTPNAQLARTQQVGQQTSRAIEARAAAERAEPIPTGEATEITPETATPRDVERVDSRLEEIRRLRQGAASPEVAKGLDAAEVALRKQIAVEQQVQQRIQTAAQLRQQAEGVADDRVRAALLEQADKVERPAIAVFTDLAAKHDVPTKAIQAAVDAARGLPPAQVDQFLANYTRALQRKGLVGKPIEPKAIEELAAGPQPEKPRKLTPKQRMAFNPETDSLLEALAKLGGIRRDVMAREFGLRPDELQQTVQVGGLKGYPFRASGGMDLDAAIERLQESGYLYGMDPADVRNAFEAAVQNDLGGGRTLTASGQMRAAADAYNERAQEALTMEPEARAERAAAMEEAGLDESELAALSDDDIDLATSSNVGVEDFMRSMGFTPEEIASEIARQGSAEKAGGGQAAEAAGGQARAAAGARGEQPGPGVAQGRAGQETGSPVDQAARAAATSPHNDLPEPSEAQKEAGNYQKGHARVAGLDISIENDEGSTRRSKADAPTQWESTMTDAHYGYIRRTEGADGEQVDVFLKPGVPEDFAGPVFVIDQVSPGSGAFDEHKAMVGYASEAEARAAYLANYEKGWTGLDAITKMPMDQFKDWVRNGDTKEPVAGQQAAAEAKAREADNAERAVRETVELRKRVSVLKSLGDCLGS